MHYRLGQGRKLGLCHGQMSSEVGNRQDRRVGRRGQERSVVKLFERDRINPPPRTSARLTAKCHENACFCQLAGASLSDGEAFRRLLKGDRLTEPLKQWGCEVYIHHAGLATGRVSVFSGLHLPASYQVSISGASTPRERAASPRDTQWWFSIRSWLRFRFRRATGACQQSRTYSSKADRRKSN